MPRPSQQYVQIRVLTNTMNAYESGEVSRELLFETAHSVEHHRRRGNYRDLYLAAACTSYGADMPRDYF